ATGNGGRKPINARPTPALAGILAPEEVLEKQQPLKINAGMRDRDRGTPQTSPSTKASAKCG
ncbi:hypothetical protein, partial [Mesorhizobium sp.]|uniref:hypothetical protein n=1 Tax=Mesorhizobium sp. TaxID=1871066 RepID=UPI00257BACD8